MCSFLQYKSTSGLEHGSFLLSVWISSVFQQDKPSPHLGQGLLLGAQGSLSCQYKTCVWKSLEVPVLTPVEIAIFENTEVPNPTRVEVPINREASTGGGRGWGAPSLPTWMHHLLSEASRPLRHLVDPEVINEERQHEEVGWGDGATWSNPQPGEVPAANINR